MQLSEEHAKLIDELLDSIDVEPWNVGLQEKIQRAREALFAQADAWPVTVAEPKAGQHCVRCGGTFGGWCDCSDNRAVRAQQQAEPPTFEQLKRHADDQAKRIGAIQQHLASSDPEGHRQAIADHEADQQAETGADEQAAFENMRNTMKTNNKPTEALCMKKPRLDKAEMLEMRITEVMTRLDEAKAEAKELRHALAVARDQMRVMANWVKFSDPAAYSWSCNAITIVNAVLERGESK